MTIQITVGKLRNLIKETATKQNITIDQVADNVNAGVYDRSYGEVTGETQTTFVNDLATACFPNDITMGINLLNWIKKNLPQSVYNKSDRKQFYMASLEQLEQLAGIIK